MSIHPFLDIDDEALHFWLYKDEYQAIDDVAREHFGVPLDELNIGRAFALLRPLALKIGSDVLKDLLFVDTGHSVSAKLTEIAKATGKMVINVFATDPKTEAIISLDTVEYVSEARKGADAVIAEVLVDQL
jgi:hypothetical protein